MKNSKKTIKLVNELMGFCYQVGIKHIEIDVKDEPSQMIIIIRGMTKKLDNERLEEAKRLLNTPRETQVEEYYWELAGEDNQAQKLALVGQMVDQAEINYENNNLEIKVYRKDD
ncbi:hypothetical protein MWH28_09840 [Natroniella sulfidigena]|uniref:hypothetical protein n=1 Tax=Natroniella sulfidigena TaxID=723921 RepID=UPI00200B05C5|nr:hypothetical protein [Natroniella sulfidigena]MCK8817659.1 hypothetical protein [Natroniella sulfidigena]